MISKTAFTRLLVFMGTLYALWVYCVAVFGPSGPLAFISLLFLALTILGFIVEDSDDGRQ